MSPQTTLRAWTVLGPPIHWALLARARAWSLAAAPLRNASGALARRWTLFATRRWLHANARASDWSSSLFRHASGYPRAGWAATAGVGRWGRGRPLSPRESDLLNHALGSADAPWGDPACSADMRRALSAKARQLARHPLSAAAGAWALRQIPPSRPDLEAHFRQAAHALDPGWHARDQHGDPWTRRLAQSEEWTAEAARSMAAQDAFLESRAMGQSTAAPHAKPGRPPKPRL